MDLNFYRNKRILITGHNGFKGSWLCQVLSLAGAKIFGVSLPEAPTDPSLYHLLHTGELLAGELGTDIGTLEGQQALERVFKEFRPELVIHMAAQPIVRESYRDPVGTYRSNVMGTVHICECVRKSETVRSFLNVTTDKVYENKEWVWGYREEEPLDGYDPYSNSKSCSELVTHSYIRSFFSEKGVGVSTARAGNVIGGGDFARDRIIPDCARAFAQGEKVNVRNPYSTRPYQHVLEPLCAYLTILQAQYEDRNKAGYYNVGPGEQDCLTTGELVDLFASAWGEGAAREDRSEQGAPHEANFLKLDCSKIKDRLGWQPRWGIARALQASAEWYKCWAKGSEELRELTRQQIREYFDVHET